ncbi:hypothetical protein GOQ27_01270 [Clostridium sp. D2Q-11]|uniref:Uncharacterized protein n=1 Tax=Anaeromonas frigoriresistens TaxID=2683708 RepID=A0A942UTD2_9FIRM|nr:hypothetical protein [Anaeromonas frigoriresistens]MBS4537070.1 hypothetical protein [Anaeromonas frigoriresistens]
MEYIKELEEITNMFLELADRSLDNKVIDEQTYKEITANKKQFLNHLQEKILIK